MVKVKLLRKAVLYAKRKWVLTWSEGPRAGSPAEVKGCADTQSALPSPRPATPFLPPQPQKKTENYFFKLYE